MDKNILKISLTLLITALILYCFTLIFNEKPFFNTSHYTTEHPLVMKSPAGDKPSSLPSLISLSKEIPLKKFRKKKISAAISMHDLNNDWSKALLEGLKETLSFYGVDIIAVTNGEFKKEKQILDLKNLIELKPDVIISLPLDADLMYDVYKDAQDAGIRLLFFDSVPIKFKSKKDYIGFVIGDSYQLGVKSAQSLSEILNFSGEVAILKWAYPMFTVDQRTEGAIKTFSNYKDIEVVEELAFQEFYQIPDLIDELCRKHPNLSGLWTVWDTPAFEAINVLKKQKNRVVVATVDMNKDVAKSIMNKGLLQTTAVDHPFSAGIAGGLLTVLDFAGHNPPGYVVIHADVVTSENLNKMWEELYLKPLDID